MKSPELLFNILIGAVAGLGVTMFNALLIGFLYALTGSVVWSVLLYVAFIAASYFIGRWISRQLET